MYSLTIHFGPNAMVWSFLFKEKEHADSIVAVLRAPCPDDRAPMNTKLMIADDFGQAGEFTLGSIHGWLLEDMDLVEEARIQRSVANARGEVKARQRASTDPVVGPAMRQGQSPAVITPRFG